MFKNTLQFAFIACAGALGGLLETGRPAFADCSSITAAHIAVAYEAWQQNGVYFNERNSEMSDASYDVFVEDWDWVRMYGQDASACTGEAGEQYHYLHKLMDSPPPTEPPLTAKQRAAIARVNAVAKLKRAKAAVAERKRKRELAARGICPSPNVDASIITAADADFPDKAKEDGAVGTAQIDVSLDASGKVIGASIYRSTRNSDLDGAALIAAERSTYAPQIVNCLPASGHYFFGVDFTGQ